MTEQDKCAKCAAPLPSSVRGGLCPACLLKRGLETNTVGFTDEDQAEAAKRWTPPTVEQLAPIFPELDILELIGRGGMGAVYKAREKQLDRLVALKILPPEIGREPAFAQRFAREAQAMAKLSHSNIVTIYSFGQRAAGELAAGGDLYFFIMEYVDGLSLRQLLDAGTVSPKEALAIVPQICDALQYAHDRGIVHRDIKPENILLNRAGQVKIADFGLAKLVGLTAAAASGAEAGSPGAPGVTQAGEKVMGTPQYMAPEQIERPREVDHRADIYSLGVVFYQMLTGELPKGKFAPPSRKVLIDVRLDEVVLRALEREPARRYQQVSEVRTQVETIIGTQPSGTDSPQLPSQSSVRGQKKASPLRSGILLAILSAGIAGYLSLLYTAKGPSVLLLGVVLPVLALVAIFVGLALKSHGGGRRKGIVLVGERNGKAVVNWPGVLALTLPLLVIALVLALWLGLAWDGQYRDWSRNVCIAFGILIAFIGINLARMRQLPPEQLTPLDAPRGGRKLPALTPEEAKRMDTARQAVKAPAIGMIVAAGIQALVALPILAMVVVRAFIVTLQPTDTTIVTRLEPLVLFWWQVLLVLTIVPTVVILWGAIRMMQVRNRGLAIVGAILALIAAPGNIIGLPMGIWALVVLSRREVVEAFTLSERNKNMGKSRISLWLLLAVIAVLTPVALWAASKAGEGQRTQSTLQPGLHQHMVLGPVIERVVSFTGENCLIDLDTGKLVTPPKEAFEGGSKTAIEWARKNGIDAGGGTQPEVQGLIGLDIIALAVDNKVWNLSGDAGLMADKRNAFAVSTPGNPVYLSAKGGVPATYKFQTREGGLGVLQIVGFTDDPKGTKIRYKMLQTAASAPHVLHTTPMAFANNVDPALDRITVTFDRPMMDKSWSFTAGDKAFSEKTGSVFPERAGEISYDAARTTCTMPVNLQPGKVYWVGVNSLQHQSFKSADGTPAKTYQILFATRSADGKPTPLPEELVKRAKIINEGFIALLSGDLKDNSVVDLDTGKVMPLEKAWPQTHELAWDNDMGGVLMVAPNSKARILALHKATEMSDALLRKVIEPDMQKLLALSQERGVPAKQARFAAVLTSEGQLAVLEIVSFTPQQAQLRWVVSEVEAYRNRLGRAAVEAMTRPAHTEWFQGALQTADLFLGALRQDMPAEAYRHATVEYREAHKGGLEQLTERMDLSNAKPTQVYVAMEAACVVVSPVTPKGRDTTVSLGLGMIRVGENYLIRDIDMLPNEQAVKQFVDGFHKAYPASEGSSTMHVTRGGKFTATTRTSQAATKPSADQRAVDVAVPVAQAWLALLDAGKIEQSWEQAAKPLQAAIAKDTWIETIKSAGKPLGKFQSRQLLSATYTTSIPGAPDGQYVVIQFESVFENKQQAVETVTPMLEADGEWRVSGYFAK